MATTDPLAPVYPPEVPGTPRPPTHRVPPNGRPWMYAIAVLAVLGLAFLFMRQRIPTPAQEVPAAAAPVDAVRPDVAADTLRVTRPDTVRATVR